MTTAPVMKEEGGRMKDEKGSSFILPPSSLVMRPYATPPDATALLTLFGLLSLGLAALLQFGTSPPVQSARPAEPTGSAEIDLRAAPPSPNLNFTSAETPAAPAPPPNSVTRAAEDNLPPAQPVAPPPVEPPALQLTEAAARPVDMPALMPPVVEPPPAPVEPPPALVTPAAVIEVPEYLRYPLRGDTPMTHLWNRLGLPAVLAAAFAAGSAPGQDPDKTKTDPILDQLKGINETLKELKKLPQSLSDLERKITDQPSSQDTKTVLTLQDMRRDLNMLRDDYAQLKRDLDALRGRSPSSTPIRSLYPPASVATGRLRLVNTYPQIMSIVVNGRAYELRPGEERYTEPLPAGLFTYEVLGVQERTSRPLAAGETFTVHVYPR